MKKFTLKKVILTALCAFALNMDTAFSQTWQVLPFTYSDYSSSAKKVFASHHSNTVIMAYKGQPLNTGYDSHISFDGGDTWQPIFTDKLMQAALFAPNGNIYLATQRFSSPFYFPDSLFRSSDGINWTNLGGPYSGNSGNQDEGDFCVTGNNTLLFPNYDGLNGLYFKKSTDNGVTWTNTGYMQGTSGSGSSNDIIQSAVASYSGDTIVVGTYNKGIRYSHDGGATFNGVSSTGVVYAMAMTPNRDVYIGGSSISTDGGVTFSSITWNPWVAMTITEFLYHQPSGKFFISAVQGIFESSDRITWINITGNLTDVYKVKDMAVSQNYVYVAKADDDNLYRYKIQGTSSISEADKAKDYFVYPNPSNEFVTIGNVPVGSTVNVFDVSGRMVYNVTVEHENTKINTASFLNGIYSLRIESNGAVATKKLVVAR